MVFLCMLCAACCFLYTVSYMLFLIWYMLYFIWYMFFSFFLAPISPCKTHTHTHKQGSKEGTLQGRGFDEGGECHGIRVLGPHLDQESVRPR